MNCRLNIGCRLRDIALACLALAFTASSSLAMDVVLLVDTSGSMGWDVQGRNHTKKDFSPPNRIERVTKALKDYITQLGKLPADQGVRLRLISFNSGVKTNKEFHLSNPQELKAALSTVESFKGEVKPDGDTWLWEAMRTAISESEKYAAQDPDITVCLYVMTDGEYDNKSPDKESDISFAKVIGESKYLGTDSLYGSLVLMGKVGGDGGFGSGYVDDLKQNSGGKFDVQISDDFTLLLPPVIQAGTIVAGQPVTLMDRSPSKFSRYEWLFDGKPVDGSDRTFDYTFPKDGRYVLTVNAYDDKGRRARSRKVITIRSAPVVAEAQVTVNGKSLAEAGEIHPGDLVTLVSKNTANVTEFLWDVNGQKLTGQTVQWKPSRIGKVTILHSVKGTSNSSDAAPHQEAQPISFSVVSPHLTADPQVMVNGKPLAEAGEINPGATVTLVSKNTQNAEQFLWDVNGEKLEGQTVSWSPSKAGEVRIIHSVIGAKVSGGDAVVQRAAAIEFPVVSPHLTADPQVMVNGKPLAEAGEINPGSTITLESRTTANAERFLWDVNGEQLEGQTVSWSPSKAGKVTIVHTVMGKNDGADIAPSQKASPVILNVVNAKLTAKARILDHGKPVEKCDVMAGDTLSLVSESTGPVAKTVWRINGQEMQGSKVDYRIENPGKTVIELLAFGNDGPPVASGEISILAKKRPAYWALVALGIVEMGIFGMFFYLFTGNKLRSCKLKAIENGKIKPLSGVTPRKYWSRWNKKASIPFRMMFKKDKFWNDKPDSKKNCLTISRDTVDVNGPGVKLGCPSASATDGMGYVHLTEIREMKTHEKREYEFRDESDSDNPQKYIFEVMLGRAELWDSALLVFFTLCLLASYFYFYLRIYPQI
jgi:uncharacterized Zn-binding protein involved in type VI secretion